MHTRPRWLIVAVTIATVVAGAAVWSSSAGDGAADDASMSTAPPTRPSANGVTAPDAAVNDDRAAGSTEVEPAEVERVVLPPFVHEYVTARSDIEVLRVRADPPGRWDADLSPVVQRSGLAPPRSGLDVDRARLPRPGFQIAGRNTVDRGWIFSNPGAFEPPQPLVMGVVQRQGRWIEVQLPVRPNGTTGWVHEAQVVQSSTTMSVEVLLGEHRLRVLRSGVEIFTAPISTGKASTPTPTGTFHVTDIVPSIDPAGGYGPVALALDGYSEVLDTFAGESAVGSPDELAPVLAIHGTNQPESIGRALSNGCPRLFNDDMVRLAGLVPAGTPVQIWP